MFTAAPTSATRAKRQVQELIDIARTPVFLLDEQQVVRPGEMGTEADIRAAAEKSELPSSRWFASTAQFRCVDHRSTTSGHFAFSGSTEMEPVPWSELIHDTDETYLVAALPSPEAMESWLLSRRPDAGDTARITAGYCWRWSDPEEVGGTKTLVDDVVIGHWRRPWNPKPEQQVLVSRRLISGLGIPAASARSAASTPPRLRV